MSHDQSRVDPVTLEVLWKRLENIPEEMGLHLSRVAFSAVIKYADDFSTALFGRDGRLLSQASYQPGHLGSMPFTMRTILDEYFSREQWASGDFVVTNDPYMNSGHLPDIFSFAPVFVDGELVGFCVTCGHHLDVGGATPGSYNLAVSDVYSEGLRIPPLKLYESGDLNEEVMEMIVANSREPRALRGDLRAQYAASNVGGEKYRSLVEEYGFETLTRYADEIIDRTERRLRTAIGEVPDGEYEFETQMDGVTEPLPIRVAVTIEGDGIEIDFTGTADQQEHYAINVVRNYAFAYVMLAVKSYFDPDVAQNQGTIAPVTLTAPERSLLNAQPPAPVSSRSVTNSHIVGTVIGALAQFEGADVPAAGGQSYRHLMRFSNPDGGQQVLFDGFFGGAGAHSHRDGFPAVSGASNIKNTPIEAIEEEYPVRVTRYELAPDTPGAGRYRGGHGTIRTYEFLRPTEVQLAGERFEFGPYGLDGGRKGNPGGAVHVSADGRERELSSKANFRAEPGDRFRVRMSGGGGYGDPDERDARSVLEDLENDLLTPEHAAAEYGVDPDDDSSSADT